MVTAPRTEASSGSSLSQSPPRNGPEQKNQTSSSMPIANNTWDIFILLYKFERLVEFEELHKESREKDMTYSQTEFVKNHSQVTQGMPVNGSRIRNLLSKEQKKFQ